MGAFLTGTMGVDLNSKEGKKEIGPGGGIPCVHVSIWMDRISKLVWPKQVEGVGEHGGVGY
jgi:histidyl-tRNA synthetase